VDFLCVIEINLKNGMFFSGLRQRLGGNPAAHEKNGAARLSSAVRGNPETPEIFLHLPFSENPLFYKILYPASSFWEKAHIGIAPSSL